MERDSLYCAFALDDYFRQDGFSTLWVSRPGPRIPRSLLPNNELAAALRGWPPELYEVGDCAEPKNIMTAMHSAYRYFVDSGREYC